MRFCIVFLCFFSILFANIDSDIASNKDKISKNKDQEKAINKKLDELGKAINLKNEELAQITQKIKQLENDISQHQSKFSIQENTLKVSQNKQNNLKAKQDKLESQLISLIAQGIAFHNIINKQAEPDSANGVIESYIYMLLYENAKKNISKLSAEKNILDNEIHKLNNSITQIQTSIKTQTTKKENLQIAKENQKVILEKMRSDLKIYDEKLKDILKERKDLDAILSKLNIVKAQKEQQSQQVFSENQKKQGSIKAPKQLGTSYRDVPTTKYKGTKTFPPLDSYKIEKPFGPYFDPVYKFKIFNAAIMFNPTSTNAKVKNVVDGKIVYAKSAPGLKKVIIIEHKDAIHTIYAYLDKIESSIKVGQSVKKGEIIGRVDERLSFEITQKDKYINPNEFIKF